MGGISRLVQKGSPIRVQGAPLIYLAFLFSNLFEAGRVGKVHSPAGRRLIPPTDE